MSRATTRYTFILILTALTISVLFVSAFRALQAGTREPGWGLPSSQHIPTGTVFGTGLSHQTLKGSVTASHLGNETVKAELGRASWRLFHTMLARFPEIPSADEQLALESWAYLFARLYPCGECAAHFQEILEKYPPQVTGRKEAAMWGCHVHNVVNTGLGKETFDCSNVEGLYDCGCGDADGQEGGGEAEGGTEGQKGGAEVKDVPRDERSVVEIEQGGWDRGG